MVPPENHESTAEGNLPRPYEDVRQWLDLVESMGELKKINGADWNLEIGTMAELIYRERSGTIPALLFAHHGIKRRVEKRNPRKMAIDDL